MEDRGTKKTNRQTERQTNVKKSREMNRCTGKRVRRMAYRQMDIWTKINRLTYKRTDRQKRKRNGWSDKQKYKRKIDAQMEK